MKKCSVRPIEHENLIRFTDTQLQEWQREGGVLLQHFFSPGEIEACRADILAGWTKLDAESQVVGYVTIGQADGYGGPMRLLIAVDSEGVLIGVRVLDHHETPGLGDAIELGRSDWILAFGNRSLSNPESELWAVRKDGGDFDQLTGATTTARAVVRAVHHFLIYFREHRDDLFETVDMGSR